MAKTCARMCASLLAFAASGMACAGLTYSNDQRFVRAQTSFGASQTKEPAIAFAPFSETGRAQSILAGGSSYGEGSQASSMSAAGFTAAGFGNPNAAADQSSGLVFAASGTSVFKISFTSDVDAILDLQGQFNSSIFGNSSASFLLRLTADSTTLVSSTTGGPFDISSLIASGVTYTLEISASANAFAFFVGSTQISSCYASFQLSGSTRSPTCPGDLNADGFVDDADFSLFAVAYNTLDCADPAMVPGCPADLNADGLVDDVDFTVFAPAYDALICP